MSRARIASPKIYSKLDQLDPKHIVLGDVGKKSPRQSAKTYGEHVFSALKKIWVMMDCICGKRLMACLPELIPIRAAWRDQAQKTDAVTAAADQRCDH
jgi:hypothetical protein